MRIIVGLPSGGSRRGAVHVMASVRETKRHVPAEAEAFRKYFGKLCEAITDPDILASTLYSEDAISMGVRNEVHDSPAKDEKTRKLLRGLEANLNPQRMNGFIRVLSNSPPLDEIARQLEQCLSGS